MTIVGIGWSLPRVVRWLGLNDSAEAERKREHEAELAARFEMMEAALTRLESLVEERDLPDTVVGVIRSHFDNRRRHFRRACRTASRKPRSTSALRLELIGLERENLHRLLREGKITDELRAADRARARPRGGNRRVQGRRPGRAAGVTHASRRPW